MPDNQAYLTKLSNDVSSLQQDMAKVGALVDRLDLTLDKLTDISSSVSSLLAVHEAKLTAQDGVLKLQSETIERRRTEVEDKLGDIYDRIKAAEKIAQEKLDEQYDEILSEIKEMRAESNRQHDTLSNRITTMEKWMWTVIGGSAIVGGLITLIPWDRFF